MLIRDQRGYSMAWTAAMFALFVLPMLTLMLDVPRFFLVRTRLQMATDAAAESGNLMGADNTNFLANQEIRFLPAEVNQAAYSTFGEVLRDAPHGLYAPQITRIDIDEQTNTVTVYAQAQITPILVPFTLTLRTSAFSQSRLAGR